VEIQRFFRDDDGQGLVEYALIIAVIAIAVIVAMIFLRGQIQNIFSNIGNNLTLAQRANTRDGRRSPRGDRRPFVRGRGAGSTGCWRSRTCCSSPSW
jgi:pilus assembly protein Flp/PilA